MLPRPVINIKCVQVEQANAKGCFYLTVVPASSARCTWLWYDNHFLSNLPYFLWQVPPVISPTLACASLLTGHQQSQPLRQITHARLNPPSMLNARRQKRPNTYGTFRLTRSVERWDDSHTCIKISFRATFNQTWIRCFTLRKGFPWPQKDAVRWMLKVLCSRTSRKATITRHLLRSKSVTELTLFKTGC